MNARELVNYLAGLAENNNRAWFAMSKPSYDILRAEFTDLVAQVIAATAKFDPAVAGQDPKKALFRINRDLRFSKGQEPVQDAFRRRDRAGRQEGSRVALLFPHRSPGHAAGRRRLLHAARRTCSRRIRAHIAKEPARFKRLLGAREPLVALRRVRRRGPALAPAQGIRTRHAAHRLHQAEELRRLDGGARSRERTVRR